MLQCGRGSRAADGRDDIHEATPGSPVASMWPRLSRRGWGVGSVLGEVGRPVQLQCGRGSRAADGTVSTSSKATEKPCFNVAAALAPRMGDQPPPGRGSRLGASMWPRLSRRGWAAQEFTDALRNEVLQCGRGSRAADGSRLRTDRRGSRSRFNVAAALAPRMGVRHPRGPSGSPPASMWPRLSRRGWRRRVTSWKGGSE